MRRVRHSVLGFWATAAAIMSVIAVDLCARPARAEADGWPTRPLTLVVPFSAGGSSDTIGRIIADGISSDLRQPVVVENVAGAGGMVGGSRVAKAIPDGYQFVIGNVGTFAQNQWLYKAPLYNAVTDFAPVALLTDESLVLVARNDLPADNLRQFIAYTKANQEKLHYSSSGAGGSNHLACMLLNSTIGIEVTHVPYRNVVQGLQEVMAGRMDYDCGRERLVVVFHDQKLSDPLLIAFSKNFGELDPPGPNPYGEPFLKDHPELNVISNVVENGKPIGNLGDGEAVWHADMTYVEVPPKAAMLHSLEVPPPEAGGNTYFANMFAAYEALPAELKEAAKDKIAVHDASTNSAGMLRKGYKAVTDVRETVGARHPLIRTEPTTGRKALFLGRRPNAYVLGLEVSESEALLDALWAHATQPRFTLCHRWKVGDVLMWNNLSVLHRRDPFDPKTRRVMHRSQIKGNERIH